ncbi:GNAT family N-acetyltransferase [Spirulina sp. 06S082]|uniref:GNAT family N-acetyltransferase n=1 Tax=Spirulina sp. 06S082 TaxID=3110248 RepID=UPI002B1F1399|nr:GNAT family N-acetyltransferase [Spirulina sp. 06S082]MEA5470629.1 GNAT family N-acetyltransferase [Spirulina sp. 06S082]
MNVKTSQLPTGYQLKEGILSDRASLLQFMILTYRELFPEQESFSHLTQTIEHYFSPETSLYWVVPVGEKARGDRQEGIEGKPEKIACLWIGNAIEQINGDRYTYIFLLYVHPEHHQRGIGSALMHYAHTLARERGDRQIGVHVFSHNLPALNLYKRLGYETQSLLMVKKLIEPK